MFIKPHFTPPHFKGFWDSEHDKKFKEKSDEDFKPVSRQEADGGARRDLVELKAQKEDKRKLDDRMKKDMPGSNPSFCVSADFFCIFCNYILSMNL